MPITNNNVSSRISNGNSTTTPLDANETFIGIWEDVSLYVVMGVLYRADQPGTIYFDYSMDGITLDRSFPSALTDLVNASYSATGPRSQFFRVRFANGGMPQSIFRMQTTLSPVVYEDAIGAVSGGVSGSSNSHIVRSVLFGQLGNGQYKPVTINTDGSLAVSGITNNGGGGGGTVAINPAYLTNNLVTIDPSPNQTILSFSSGINNLTVTGFSVFVYDTEINGFIVFLGQCTIALNDSPVYTAQLSTMNGGTHSFTFSTPINVSIGQVLTISCSPSAPITQQTWQANIIGAYN